MEIAGGAPGAATLCSNDITSNNSVRCRYCFIPLQLAQLEKTSSVAGPNQLLALKQENEKLKKEVEIWKQKLVQAGLSHGVRAFSTSAPSQPPMTVSQPEKQPEKEAVPPGKEAKKAKEPKKKETG